MEEESFTIPKIKVVLNSEVEIQVVESDVEVNERHTVLAEEIVNIEKDSDDDEIVLDSEINDSRE